jgi:hypothetical protein
MKRRIVIPVLFSSLCGGMVMAASSRKNRHCSVELPNHAIEYSLPEEVAREMRPEWIHSSYNPTKPFERGYQGIVGATYDFNGPVWVGALGTLSFDVLMQQRAAEYQGDITTIEGLQKYISWWFPLVNKVGKFGATELNGAPAVLRKFGEWDECWSFPIDQAMFVEFGLRVEPVAGKWSGGWVKKARAMRDGIRASIRFRKFE